MEIIWKFAKEPPVTGSSSSRMTSSEEFRQFGTAMINYVADYLDNIRDRRVVPEVGGGCQGVML